ncbi:MAG: hypothetical protein JW740_00280 [Candidatus Zambryskibacteria bacterium]|nr:hypothetical protein [Candidatus Zambryskibacteria bacterium]
MAPEFRSSFIPKGSVNTEKTYKKKGTGFLGVLSVALFLSTLIVSGFVYFYKFTLDKEIRDLQAQLAEVEKNMDKEIINEILAFDRKLDLTKTLINKHKVVSNFLENLSSTTVSRVWFDNFSYNMSEQGGLTADLEGESSSYATLALQEDIFNKNEFFRSVTFSNLNLTDKGRVSFSLKIEVDPEIAIYSP